MGWLCNVYELCPPTCLESLVPTVCRDWPRGVPLPKTPRHYLTWFFTIVVLCLVTMVFVCFQSCATVCSGLCNMSGVGPMLDMYHYNYSKVRFSHTKRYLPKCIVIGVRKAGTRALLRYLDIHPEIVTARDEIHFFDIEEEYHQGLEYYRRRMPYSFKHQLTIEKTPSYFVDPLVPERVYRMNSSILLLVIVRDPVTRLISDYVQLKEKLIKKGKQVLPLESVVFDKKGNVHSGYSPVQVSAYSFHMARWLEFFPLQQIHVVDGDALVEDPYKEMCAVESFLGLEHRITPDKFYYNSTKGFYCVNDGNLSTCLGETKGRTHPPVDPTVLEKLRNFYSKRNQIFFKMVNRTFNWL